MQLPFSPIHINRASVLCTCNCIVATNAATATVANNDMIVLVPRGLFLFDLSGNTGLSDLEKCPR